MFDAYLSVHYTCAPFEDSMDLYNAIFSETGVALSYVGVLEFATYAGHTTCKLAVTFTYGMWGEGCHVEKSWWHENATICGTGQK